ncbi:MAG: acetyl-CoA carboxylase carboxyltransferase subunit alpha [Gammaproteobacteria bacterium]|nr:acetyl-CoA carboxylase carboxyltransferase subunit alpha [Gammaproteobacteria bacterium]
MNLDVLDFEKPIVELDQKIKELRNIGHDSALNIVAELESLENKREQLLQSIYADLSRVQVVQLARHPKRPHAIDYINKAFTDFDELHGDRHFADDPAIIGGIARLDDKPVIVICEEKGRTTKEKIARNFAMPRPEGYRKALRLMEMAEKFSLPIITLIDTPGAYPGIGAEERNQSEAIAKNLKVMSRLKTPIICTVIGEGGSGGALAIGVGDRILMLQYSIYSVISPEGCASILWRSADKAGEAAEAMKLTSQDSLKNKLIDEVINEPIGGAHRDYDEIAITLRHAVSLNLQQLEKFSTEELVERRYNKLMNYGIY